MINPSKLKPVRIFPLLYDISPFIEQEHPTHIHPDTPEYAEYWEPVEKKCIEGIWGLDKKGDLGGYRYMTPQCYFYINITKIIDEDESGGTEIINPLLRDVEWILSYDWLTAKGFSGFEDDDIYTCSRIVGKLEKGIELLPLEKLLLEKAPGAFNSKGLLKKFRDPLEFLHSTHERPYGKPLYENQNLNTFILGTRGGGKSFFGANGVVGHEFVFFGKKRYDDAYFDPSPVSILVGSSVEPKSKELLEKFELTMNYLKGNVGAYGKDESFIPGFFYRNTSGTLESGKFYKHHYRYKENNEWKTGGSGTEIQHRVFTQQNKEAGAGGRFNVILVEETGLCEFLPKVHGINETTQIRRTKFGSSYYIGTGGNMEKVMGSKIIFLNPAAYDMIAIEDEFEGRIKPIGRFIPSTYVNSLFKDKNGNTDIEASFAQEMAIRAEKLKAGDMSAYLSYATARPLTWSEMFLNSGSNLLPSIQASERYTELETTEEDLLKGAIGRLEYIDKDRTKVKFSLDSDLKPILDNSTKNLESLRGASIMYEPPPYNLPEFTYKSPPYRIVYDPVKDDHGGSSLASVIVYKTTDFKNLSEGCRDCIVYEWIGRHDSVDDNHEEAIKAAFFYGQPLLPEINIRDIIRYATKRGIFHILQPTPFKAIGKYLKDPKFKYQVGVEMVGTLPVQCEQLLKQMLLKERDNDGGDEKKTVISTFNSRRACAEIADYDREKNFDHVSSLKILALWLEQDQMDQSTPEEQKKNLEDFKSHMIKEAHRAKKKMNLYYEF